MEVVVVKVFKGKVLLETKNFNLYTKALDYAKKQSYLGFNSLILRLSNNKEWVRLWVNSQLN